MTKSFCLTINLICSPDGCFTSSDDELLSLIDDDSAYEDEASLVPQPPPSVVGIELRIVDELSDLSQQDIRHSSDCVTQAGTLRNCNSVLPANNNNRVPSKSSTDTRSADNSFCTSDPTIDDDDLCCLQAADSLENIDLIDDSIKTSNNVGNITGRNASLQYRHTLHDDLARSTGSGNVADFFIDTSLSLYPASNQNNGAFITRPRETTGQHHSVGSCMPCSPIIPVNFTNFAPNATTSSPHQHQHVSQPISGVSLSLH